MSKQQLYKPITILVLVLGSTSIALCGTPPPPTSVPLDGGLFLLIGAGVMVAVKKVFFK